MSSCGALYSVTLAKIIYVPSVNLSLNLSVVTCKQINQNMNDETKHTDTHASTMALSATVRKVALMGPSMRTMIDSYRFIIVRPSLPLPLSLCWAESQHVDNIS